MANKSILKNYIYNSVYQVFLILIPIILTPYLSRVLTPTGIGQYSFTMSIVTYFTLFAEMGFNLYGQREIAKVQNDKVAQSKLFWEIVLAKLVTTCISVCVYFGIAIVGGYKMYTTLMVVLSLNVISIAFDITFLFQGNEEFKKIVFRNVIVRIVSIVLIFIFVKSIDDLLLYSFIMGGTMFVGRVSLWAYLPKYLTKIKIKSLEVLKHLKPALFLFIPTIVISIYTVLDRTLIGVILKIDSETGYYEQGEKIVKMIITLITCLSTVMAPRNSAEYKAGNIEKVKENIYKSIKFTWFAGMPCTMGIIAVAKNMNLWFFGPGYEPVINIMIAFSPMIMILGLNCIFGVQFLIATGKEKIYTISVTCGAVLNFVMNIILIKLVGTIGAVIASIMAEFCVLLIPLIYLKNTFSIRKILLMGWKNVLGSILMFIPIYLMGQRLESSIWNTFLIVIIGFIIYLAISFILKDELISEVIKILKNKINRKEKIDEKF